MLRGYRIDSKLCSIRSQQLADTTLLLSGPHSRPLATGLAQKKYLEDKAFLNYLQYLEYWRKPEYAQYIRCELGCGSYVGVSAASKPYCRPTATGTAPASVSCCSADPLTACALVCLLFTHTHTNPYARRFPHCLFMLELLQSEHFRQAVALPQVTVRWV